jgi:hypothetical protein
MPPFLTLLQFHGGLHGDLQCTYLTIVDRWCILIVTVICLEHLTPASSSCRGDLPCTQRWRSRTSIIGLSSAAHCQPGRSPRPFLVTKSSPHLASLVDGMLQVPRVDRFRQQILWFKVSDFYLQAE